MSVQCSISSSLTLVLCSAYEIFLFRSTVFKSTEAEGRRELSLMNVQPSIAENRETREGWPLLPVETEANGDTKSTNERGPSLVGLLGSSCRYKIYLSCLGCSSRPSKKYFFHHRTLFIFICLRRRRASGAGCRSGSLLLICVSDWKNREYLAFTKTTLTTKEMLDHSAKATMPSVTSEELQLKDSRTVKERSLRIAGLS
jgi:hypothetical protein